MKGIALSELAYLIVAIILVVILFSIFFLFQFPFMVFPLVLFDHISTLLRGLVIAGIWSAYWAFFAFFFAVIWISMADPSCWGPQAVGCAAKNAILTTIVIGILTWIAFSTTSSIPLAYKSIDLKVDNVSVDKNLADWVVDTSYMASSGNNDPFAGTSTNPKISFTIVVTKGKFNLKDALYRLDVPTYSIYDKIKGDVWDDSNVMKGKNWHSDTFNVDIKIDKSKSGTWYLTVWNDSYHGFCDFESHTEDGSSWSHPWKLSIDSDLGIIEPQENTFKCGNGKEYSIFVGPSNTNPYRLRVTIGKYSLKYKKLKNVMVEIEDSSGHWNEYGVVSSGSNFNLNGLNKQFGKGTTIYLDYLDTCGFCSYHATECGGDLPSIEGVYICIPYTSG